MTPAVHPQQWSWLPRPPGEGWHWLLRVRDGRPCMAHWSRRAGFWRVSDVIGRTVIVYDNQIIERYQYLCAVPDPKTLGLVK